MVMSGMLLLTHSLRVNVDLLAGLAGTAARSQTLRRVFLGLSNLDRLTYVRGDRGLTGDCRGCGADAGQAGISSRPNARASL